MKNLYSRIFDNQVERIRTNQRILEAEERFCWFDEYVFRINASCSTENRIRARLIRAMFKS